MATSTNVSQGQADFLQVVQTFKTSLKNVKTSSSQDMITKVCLNAPEKTKQIEKKTRSAFVLPTKSSSFGTQYVQVDLGSWGQWNTTA